ncbi:MAG: ubiquitin-conjugating enzyme E2 [Pirellulaceae bacterium]
MPSTDRDQRLLADLEAMRALKEASSIFDFEAKGDPPDRYTVLYRGKGLTRGASSSGGVEIVDLHRCEVRLPYSYPERPPDVRWLTPIFHPNVSFSGFLNLREIGITWEKGLSLDIVCERLWDVARAGYTNLETATNYSARNWYAKEGDAYGLPVDRRPLRDRAVSQSGNVVRYQRRGGSTEPAATVEPPSQEADVLYIGEDTPPPETPAPTRRRSSDGGDVFYIGDE